MVGRGTRLCPDLFGPGKDKTGFDILDYCENLEFFSVDGATSEGRLADSLGKRLFTTRLELELDRPRDEAPASDDQESLLRRDTAGVLLTEVSAMNLDNFIVRPQRKLVAKSSEPEPWQALSDEDLTDLARRSRACRQRPIPRMRKQSALTC